MPTVQREYKDRLFNFIFGSEENKAWTLSLYNAVNNTNYTDPDAVQINTIKEVLYLGMHNDASFLLAEDMNLKEYVIKPFLDANKMEVSTMLLTEYNEAEAMELFEKDGDRKRMISAARGMNQEGIALDVIARILKISIDEVKNILGVESNLA